jgi:transcriptional regulator with XRE-family HTH domain
MDMRRLVGRNVKRIRLSNGLSQEQFAERSGFTQQYISDLERGRRNPTVVSLFDLAQALGVSHVELVTPDEEVLASPAPRSAKTSRQQG